MHVLPFLVVAVIVVVTPGVDMALVTKNALLHARRAALATAFGVTVGIALWTLAAALGVAAVVPDRSAAQEAVVDGVTGLVFRSGDEADLRAKLQVLQREPRLADAMGAAAYDRYWSSPPTLQRHVERLEAVYAEILSAA